MDINKKDNFGRTPLYYLLASFNENTGFTPLKTYLLAGATLNIPSRDPYFYYFKQRPGNQHETIGRYMFVLATTPSIDYRSNAITDDIRELVKNLLQSDYSDRNKWSHIIWGFEELFIHYRRITNVTDNFSYFYCLVQDVCSDLGIELQLFHPENMAFSLWMEISRHIEILKFLISKGIDMNDICLGSNNLMDHCILNSNFDSVEFLTSIGVRPKGTLLLLTDGNSKISPRIKKLVKENCFKLSLKNMCRLKINKSLNVDEAVNKVPRSIREFIRFRTN